MENVSSQSSKAVASIVNTHPVTFIVGLDIFIERGSITKQHLSAKKFRKNMYLFPTSYVLNEVTNKTEH
jgi:hypothetical protein